MTILRLPAFLACSVLTALLLLPKAAHAQSTTLRPTSAAGTDTPPPSTLSSTASCDYGMSNCLLYNCNGCKNLFDDSCWGCHKCCASVKQDCIKGQADAVGFDKCGNGPTPQPTSPTLTPTLRSTLYPTSGKNDAYTLEPTATPTQRPMQTPTPTLTPTLRSTLYPTTDEYAQSTTLSPTASAVTDTPTISSTLPSTASCEYGMHNCLLYNCNGCTNWSDDFCWRCYNCCVGVQHDCIKGQAGAAGHTKCGNGPTPTLRSTSYPTSGTHEKEAYTLEPTATPLPTPRTEEQAEMPTPMYDFPSFADGEEEEEKEEEEDSLNLSVAGAIVAGAIVLGIVICCCCPVCIFCCLGAASAEVSPSVAEVPPLPVASAVLTCMPAVTGTSGDGDVQDLPLGEVDTCSMDYGDHTVPGVSSPHPSPSAPPAE